MKAATKGEMKVVIERSRELFAWLDESCGLALTPFYHEQVKLLRQWCDDVLGNPSLDEVVKMTEGWDAYPTFFERSSTFIETQKERDDG